MGGWRRRVNRITDYCLTVGLLLAITGSVMDFSHTSYMWTEIVLQLAVVIGLPGILLALFTPGYLD